MMVAPDTFPSYIASRIPGRAYIYFFSAGKCIYGFVSVTMRSN
jgi:hypothetical protein